MARKDFSPRQRLRPGVPTEYRVRSRVGFDLFPSSGEASESSLQLLYPNSAKLIEVLLCQAIAWDFVGILSASENDQRLIRNISRGPCLLRARLDRFKLTGSCAQILRLQDQVGVPAEACPVHPAGHTEIDKNGGPHGLSFLAPNSEEKILPHAGGNNSYWSSCVESTSTIPVTSSA